MNKTEVRKKIRALYTRLLVAEVDWKTEKNNNTGLPIQDRKTVVRDEVKALRKSIKEYDIALDLLTRLDTMVLTVLGSNWMPWVIEHRFDTSDDKREWRFDYASQQLGLAIEINGGVHTQGRHTRGQGFKGDMQKLNAAQLQGWTVLQYTPRMEAALLRDVKLHLDKLEEA